MAANFWNKVKAWYTSPYSSSMTATDWFLFIGFLLFIMALWRMILGQLNHAAS